MRLVVIRALTIGIILLLWQGIAMYTNNPKLFPSPIYIFTDAIPDIANFQIDAGGNRYYVALKVLGESALISGFRILTGIVLGFLAGFLYGLSIHYFKKTQKGNILLLKILRSIPLLALIPLFYCWFGGQGSGIILYIAFATFTVLSTGTYEAVLNVPAAYEEQCQMLGGSRLQIFKFIFVYAIAPELIASAVNIVGLSWAISLAAEYLSSSKGLGYLVVQSYDNSNMAQLIVLIIVYSNLGLVSCYAVKALSKRIVYWN